MPYSTEEILEAAANLAADNAASIANPRAWAVILRALDDRGMLAGSDEAASEELDFEPGTGSGFGIVEEDE